MFKKVLIGIAIFLIGFLAAWVLKGKDSLSIRTVMPFSMSVLENYVTITGSIKALNYEPGYAVNSTKIMCRVESGICKVDIVGLMDGFLNFSSSEYKITAIKNNVIYAEEKSSTCVNEFLEVDTDQKTVLMKDVKKNTDNALCNAVQGTKLSEVSEYYPSIKKWKKSAPHI